MSYGPSSGLLRGPSAVWTIDPQNYKGRRLPKMQIGLEYNFDGQAYIDRPVVQVRALSDEVFAPGVSADDMAGQGLCLTLVTPDGRDVCRDMPLFRIAQPNTVARLQMRNIVFEPTLIDPRKSFVTRYVDSGPQQISLIAIEVLYMR